jgi:hypothetical protein
MKFFGIKLELFKRREHQDNTQTRLEKGLEIFIKSFIMLSIPIVPSSICFVFWSLVLFRNQIYFEEKMENILVAACIPVFGLFYSLWAQAVFNTVWEEYKAIRTAIKDYDIETFMNLVDEEVSPLVYVLIGMFAFGIMGSFMTLKYHDVRCGAIIIIGVSYFLSLVFLVIREIDNPCSGVWFIKHIDEKWLAINPKDWRDKRNKKLREELMQKLTQKTG